MGNGNVKRVKKQQQEINRKIDDDHYKEQEEEKSVIKLLLLGTRMWEWQKGALFLTGVFLRGGNSLNLFEFWGGRM